MGWMWQSNHNCSSDYPLLGNGNNTTHQHQSHLELWLCRCAPRLYKSLHQYLFTFLLLRPVEKIRCPMVTVSDLIEDYGIK